MVIAQTMVRRRIMRHHGPMTDAELLDVVIRAKGLLERERKAFGKMARRVLGDGKELTPAQRAWAGRVARKLGLFEKGRRPTPSAWEPRPR